MNMAETIISAVVWLGLSVFVALLAAAWGRNPSVYFFGSLLLSPLYGYLRLLIEGKAEGNRRL